MPRDAPPPPPMVASHRPSAWVATTAAFPKELRDAWRLDDMALSTVLIFCVAFTAFTAPFNLRFALNSRSRA